MSEGLVRAAVRNVYWKVLGDVDTLLDIFFSLLVTEVDNGRRPIDVVGDFEALVNELARRYNELGG